MTGNKKARKYGPCAVFVGSFWGIRQLFSTVQPPIA